MSLKRVLFLLLLTIVIGWLSGMILYNGILWFVYDYLDSSIPIFEFILDIIGNL